MISQKDKIILQDIGKKQLLNIAFNSPLVKNKLTFKEHINFCQIISELSYPEVIQTIFNEDIRSFEGRFTKFLKYGFAAVASLKLTDNFTGTLAAPPLAMFILFTYRKLTDTCHKQCQEKWPLSTQKKICNYSCQLQAAIKVASQIRTEMSRCASVSKPESCRKKLEKQYIVWAKRVSVLKIKLSKAKIGEEAKRRKTNTKAMKARMRTLKASFQLPKSQFINLIAENQHLRKNITFQEHLKIYQLIKNLSEDDPIVKPHKINPEREKKLRWALYAGLFVVPIPFFNDVVNYYVKKINIKCLGKCIKQLKYSQKLCRNQCSYLSAQSAIKFLKKELPKCKDSKNPVKCKKKIHNLLMDWSSRETEARLKYKFQLDKEIRQIKKRETK